MNFQKTELPYLQTVIRQVQTQEQTQEVRLGDEMPDIGRVLSSWGQVLIRSKEWRTGTLGISGGIMVWTLYAPEDGSAPQSIQAWLPFQMKWEISEETPEGNVIVTPLTYSVDARSTSSRKLMIRANIGVLLEGICEAKETLFEPEDIPEDIFLLQNNYPVSIPAETGEKAFVIEEAISLPSSQPAPIRFLRYEVLPEITDQRVLTDKLIFRGRLLISLLYADSEGEIHGFKNELPISQYAELKGEYSEKAYADVYSALTSLDMELSEDGSVLIKAGLLGQYLIYDFRTMTLTEDAYSAMRNVSAKMKNMDAPVVWDRSSDTVTVEYAIDEDILELIDVVFYPEHPRLYREELSVMAELSGNVHILYYDKAGMLRSKVCRWQDKYEVAAADNAFVYIDILPYGSLLADASETQKVRLNVKTIGEIGVQAIELLELGDICELDPERPNLVLRRRGEESLWEIAKRTGSSVEMIRKVNNIPDEPEADALLLIPII